MTSPSVSILIVNYNAGAFLQKAVDSVALQKDRDFELIIIDNASTDGSMDTLKTDHISDVKIILLEENTGFAAANNLGARKAKGTWIALLNPDAEALPDWLAEFRSARKAFPATVMFAGPTIKTTDPAILDGAGDCYFGFGIPWRGGYGRPIEELPQVGECFSACGASALIHRQTFLETGGFYERFFCYCEDVDLGFRLRLEGHNCIFWPDAVALHYGSGTTSLASDFSVRYGTRNRLWTFVRNMPPLGLVLGLPFHLLLTGALLIRAMMVGRAGPTAAGLRDALLGIGPVLASRKNVQARRQLSTVDIIKSMSWKWSLLRNRKADVKPISSKPASGKEFR